MRKKVCVALSAFLIVPFYSFAIAETVYIDCVGLLREMYGPTRKDRTTDENFGYVIQFEPVTPLLHSIDGENVRYRANNDASCNVDKLTYECERRYEFGKFNVYANISFNRASGQVDEFIYVEPYSSVYPSKSYNGVCKMSKKPKF
jgi:hypothetical protein